MLRVIGTSVTFMIGKMLEILSLSGLVNNMGIFGLEIE